MQEPENLHIPASDTKILGTWLIDTFLFVNIVCVYVCACARTHVCACAVGLQ